jgi:carboxylesterase
VSDEPFFLPGVAGRDACLLVHGSTGTAGDMRFLGDFLHARGYTVEGVALPGHRRRPADLKGVDWRACYHAVDAAWRALTVQHSRVHVIGFSLGAALGIHLASRESVTSLVLLAPALYVHMRPGALVNIATAIEPGMPLAAYVRWHVGLARFFRLVREDVGRVHCPVLAIHARDDDTVRVESSVAVFERVAAADRRLLVLERGGHLLPSGIARERICAETAHHLDALRRQGNAD